jgi:hypothetical protein
MNKLGLDQQEMFKKLDEICALSEDAKMAISYGYERGYNYANKINRKNNIIGYVFVFAGFIIGNIISRLF